MNQDVALSEDASIRRIKLVRNYSIFTFLRVVTFIITEVLLIRVMAPWCIDQNSDILGWCGMALIVIGVVAVPLMVVDMLLSYFKFRKRYDTL